MARFTNYVLFQPLLLWVPTIFADLCIFSSFEVFFSCFGGKNTPIWSLGGAVLDISFCGAQRRGPRVEGWSSGHASWVGG